MGSKLLNREWHPGACHRRRAMRRRWAQPEGRQD